MPTEVRYSSLAIEDLDEILRYVSEELASPIAAEKIVFSILDRVSLLARFPESGTRLDAICEISSEWRFVVSGNYVAFYRLVGGDVLVDRVLYGRSDYLDTLTGDAPEE
jgi:plasmid stabilization system protein ParE